MSIAIGDPITGGAAPGAILYVGGTLASPILAQDSAGLIYEDASNTIKSKDQNTASASSDLAISTGDILATSSVSSGALKLDTGVGGTASSSSPGGDSGNLSLNTGDGGDTDTGAAGDSGDLLLKTGHGGTSNTGAAGSGGDIIIQPGTSGGGRRVRRPHHCPRACQCAGRFLLDPKRHRQPDLLVDRQQRLHRHAYGNPPLFALAQQHGERRHILGDRLGR